jgi:hypothetical protein
VYCVLRGLHLLARVLARTDQPPVGGGGAPFALDLEVGGEGAPGGMLRFFSVVSPGCFWVWDCLEEVHG